MVNLDFKIAFREVFCTLCGSKSNKTILTAKDHDCGIPGLFTISRCNECGMCYLNPQPTFEDIHKVYPRVYADKYMKELPYRLFDKRIKLLKSLLPDGRLLEIGCAAGHFLNIARASGYEVSGVEIDNELGGYARKHYNLDVQISPIEMADLPDSYFNIVTLFKVFEHLTEPMASLNKIKQTLAPGGYCIIQVPNFSCLESKLLGRYWCYLDSPRHLSHFSPDTLTNMLIKAGFLSIRILHYSEPSGFHISIIKWFIDILGKKSGRAMATQTGNISYAYKNLKLKKFIYKDLSLIWRIPNRILTYLGQGNVLLAIAQRP